MIIFYAILLLLIISACKTVEYVEIEYTLPEEPQRQNLYIPENPTLKDYATIIIYYDFLVEKWERWALSVKKIVPIKNAEILTEEN